MANKRFYAIHEAGHVLVLWTLGCTFRYCTLKSYKDRMAFTSIQSVMEPIEICAASLGGLAATLVAGEKIDHCFNAASLDLEILEDRATDIDELDTFSWELLDAAAICTAKNWAAVEELAELLIQKDLKANEAEKILRKHKVPRKHPERPFRSPTIPRSLH